MGRQEMQEAGRDADRHPPEARLFDAGGRRLDEVSYHPAYHRLMAAGIGAGYAAIAWEGRPGGQATHAAMVYLTSQIAPGVCAPMTMTHAAIPALGADTGLFETWVPKLTARVYDGAARPLARKPGATLGMAMAEKQGGSDLRGSSTRAEAEEGGAYRLTGHKWFCSAPMSDGFLTLAQARGGLSCFLVPRWLDAGRNPVRIQRLKTTLGNRANAVAEIEFHGARAFRLGEEGDGLRRATEMAQHVRLDSALASAGVMRAALDHAWHWVRHRSAFERQLSDQPLMRAVLADLVLDWEGALALGLFVAARFDEKGAEARAFVRLGAGLAKFLNNKLCPGLVCEAMECLGGTGYVEDTPLPLFYREAPFHTIWEGPGNIICLDVLAMLRRAPLAGELLAQELGRACGQDARFDAGLKAHMRRFAKLPDAAQARRYVESLATLLTAAVLIRSAPAAVAEAYVATRLEGARGRIAGSISGVDVAALLARLHHRAE